ncbi:hypothetical protein, partial [Aneurinibacillus aneurinilyticus]|uniref:hypothetical protein n=1 Tax=Aneurinibacillus aneurinilyticus TaxID=1391 RepID=UPI00366EDE9B
FLKGTLVLLYHDCDNVRLRLTEIHLPLSLVLSPSRLEVEDFFRREVKNPSLIRGNPVYLYVTLRVLIIQSPQRGCMISLREKAGKHVTRAPSFFHLMDNQQA